MNGTTSATATSALVDFHCHYLGPAFEPTPLPDLPPAQRNFWARVNGQLASEAALLEGIGGAGLAARVVSTPLEFVRTMAGSTAAPAVSLINDELARLVQRHPGRLYGLATVDLFSGEAGARELERAVQELGLHGVFVESARDALLPDAAQARPTFAMAAQLGVPVFMHPVPDPAARKRFERCGSFTERLSRSTNNSAALLALLEHGVFEECPGLEVVVTALALNGLCIAACQGDGARLHKGEPAASRRHVYIDTTGLSPVMVRAAVEIVGADHVLLGTDWPVVDLPGLSARVEHTLAAAGLDAADRQRVTSGNALRLLSRQ